MMYLAAHEQEGPCNANDICLDQDISISYLEQLFAHLRKAGLVTGIRGPGGGYRLGRPADQITIAQIVTAVDDHAYVPRKRNIVDLYHGEHSKIQKMWHDLSTRLYKFLDGITLAECVHGKEGFESEGGDEETTEAASLNEPRQAVCGGPGGGR